MLRIVRPIFDVVALGAGWRGVFAHQRCAKQIAALACRRPIAERRDQVMALFAAVAAIDALRFAWPWATRVMMLAGGDDTMTYESYARDILFNGILMSGGKPLGQGEPFYYQAFYPYFLAGTHAVFGEFMFGAVLVQRLLAAFAIVKLVEIAIRFTTERALDGGAADRDRFHRLEVLAHRRRAAERIALRSAAGRCGGGDDSAVRSSRRRVARSGRASLSGLAAITRSTALLAWVVVWPAVWLATARPRRARTRDPRAADCVVRRRVFAGRDPQLDRRRRVRADVNRAGHHAAGRQRAAAGFDDRSRRDVPLYQRLGISDITASVIEYAITEPRLFALNLGRKALFVLGFYEPYAPGWGYSPVYILTWTTAIAGAWLAVRNRQGLMWPVLIPAIVSLTQFVAIVIVYPKGERLVVPVHIVLIPYCAAAAWFALNRRSSEAANVNLIANRMNT